MKQLPDDHFRRRLKDHSLPPAPSAWSRIESGLPAKHRNAWVKVAAAVLLLLTASAVILLVRDNHNPQTVAEEHTLPKADPPRLTDSTGDAANDSNAIPAEEPKAMAEAPPARRDTPVDRNATAKEVVLPERIDNRMAENIQDVPDDAVTIEPIPDTNATVAPLTATVATNEETPFKLVLEADEVQAKYLRKKSVARATEEEDEPSGLRKLLDKANDISNQDHLGDLRQMKNDIFALNFQGKKRDQHK